MRGAPQSGFSRLICRIKSRSSLSIFGRPTGPRDFQRQRARYPALCQPITVSGNDMISPHNRGDFGAFPEVPGNQHSK
jgi:hypothetical protein